MGKVVIEICVDGFRSPRARRIECLTLLRSVHFSVLAVLEDDLNACMQKVANRANLHPHLHLPISNQHILYLPRTSQSTVLSFSF